jgi:hypothetical protein
LGAAGLELAAGTVQADPCSNTLATGALRPAGEARGRVHRSGDQRRVVPKYRPEGARNTTAVDDHEIRATVEAAAAQQALAPAVMSVPGVRRPWPGGSRLNRPDDVLRRVGRFHCRGAGVTVLADEGSDIL